MANTFIYALCEPGTRRVRYIGKTSKTAQKRLARHLKESIKLDTHLGDWLRQIVSCGAVPTLIVLREVPGDGSEAEKRFIRLARGCRMKLVNGTEGGEGGVPTPETREKQRAANLGENNPMFGKTRHLSLETRAKISSALCGRIVTHETREKLRAALVGKPKSAEHNAKNSAAQKRLCAARKAAKA